MQQGELAGDGNYTALFSCIRQAAVVVAAKDGLLFHPAKGMPNPITGNRLGLPGV